MVEFRLSANKRARYCLRAVTKGRLDVEVRQLRTPDGPGPAFFAGLQTCGSVWDCPHCSAKISERRRVELLAGIAAWKMMGGQVFMLTLTHPHHEGDRLADLLASEQKALAWFLGHRAVKELLNGFGVEGHIRAWEVTHGRRAYGNGWHPHFHMLFFVRCPHGESGTQWADHAFEALREPLFALWAKACVRAGLEPPTGRRGLRVDTGEDVEGYAVKWGLDAEMTKGHTKKAAKGKGETPFELLDAILEDPSDGQAMALFSEFSAAYRGKRQLVWSRGLRDLLGIGKERTDEEVAAEGDEESQVLGLLTLGQWRKVLRARAEPQLCEVAEALGWPGVLEFLSTL